MDKVSIIVPVYNVEKYLPTCIESILNQSYKNFELILVDDGSPDKSGDICDDFAKKDNRIKVIHQKNSGVSKARNTGIDNATGEWILFVDSDDELTDTSLECYISSIAESNDVDAIVSGMKKIFVNDAKEIEYFTLEDSLFYNNDFESLYYYLKSKYMFGLVCSKLYRNSIIKNNDIRFNEILASYEDELFFVDYLAHCDSVKTISDVTYIYRRFGNESLCSKYIPVEKRIETVQCLHKSSLNISDSTIFKETLVKNYVDMLFQGITSLYEPKNNKELSRKERIRSIRIIQEEARQKGLYKRLEERLTHDRFLFSSPIMIDVIGMLKCLKYKTKK